MAGHVECQLCCTHMLTAQSARVLARTSQGSTPLGLHVAEVATLPQLVRKAVLSTSFAQHAAALSEALWPIRSRLCMHCQNQSQH